MTEETLTTDRRRREGAEHMLTMIDDAVLAAVEHYDVDPEIVRDRCERMVRWLEGDESVEPGERPACPAHPAHETVQ